MTLVEAGQDRADAISVLFAPDRVEQVADIPLLKRRRRMSEAERQRLASIGFKSGRRAYTGVHP